MEQNRTKRIVRWDNVKGFLIFLVVIGHFMYYLGEKGNKTPWIQSVYFFIYLFHMPLFVFISGMMERRTIATGAGLRKKVIGFLILGMGLRMVNFSVRYVSRDVRNFHLTLDQSVVWYLVALSVWIPVTYLIRKTDRRLLLAASLMLALIVGYDPSVGGDFCLSRILTFYPFFLLGTMTDPAELDEKLNRTPDLWKTASLFLMLAILVFCLLANKYIWPFLDILKGWKPYWKLRVHPGFGLVFRAAWYVAAVVMSAAVLLMSPGKPGVMTGVGTRTMQIYLLHRPVQHVFWFTWAKNFVEGNPAADVAYLLVGAALFLVLAHPVFKKPLDWFWTLVWKDEPEAEAERRVEAEPETTDKSESKGQLQG